MPLEKIVILWLLISYIINNNMAKSRKCEAGAIVALLKLVW